uniref:Uncharacterized protein n=1 Tax=Panagrolaimus sp. ES5 TaxID=591445 RepID=A0AC34FEZ9_9BILA
MQNNGFSIIPGFNQEPQSDGRNLAALFGDDTPNEQQIVNDLDFRYDPASLHEPEPIIPKPRSRRYSGNGTSEISLGEPIPVDFAEYKIHTVYLSIVNGEVLRFDDCEDGSMLCSISFSSFRLSTIGNAVAICIGNEIQFMGDSELYTKLCTIISARHILEPLIFSFGDGEEEIQENSHVLFSQLSFNFCNNELKTLPEETTDSKHLKMKAKRFEDSFLKNFKGKKSGAKFIVAIDGIGSCFEIKKVKNKTSPASDMISDSSRQITPPPLIIDEIQQQQVDDFETMAPRQSILATSSTLQTRMSKMGGIQLLPVEIVQPKPQEKEIENFKGKKSGAKFIVAIDGIGSCFEIKKVKNKTSPASDMISIKSDSSRQITPPPLIIDDIEKHQVDDIETMAPRQSILATSSTLQTRMSKMGGIQLLPVEIVQPKPQEKEIEVVAEEEESPPRTSPPIPPSPLTSNTSSKPIPIERKTSIIQDTTITKNKNFEDLEKRVAELEAKVEQLSANPFSSSSATTSIPPSSQSATPTEKYEFAMDLWAQISASLTIPSDVKPEIKKIILSSAFQP